MLGRRPKKSKIALIVKNILKNLMTLSSGSIGFIKAWIRSPRCGGVSSFLHSKDISSGLRCSKGGHNEDIIRCSIVILYDARCIFNMQIGLNELVKAELVQGRGYLIFWRIR